LEHELKLGKKMTSPWPSPSVRLRTGLTRGHKISSFALPIPPLLRGIKGVVYALVGNIEAEVILLLAIKKIISFFRQLDSTSGGLS
jgi:hypothetical protein